METWKAVPGFEGLYEVSDLGRVRSLDRITVQRHFASGKMMNVSRRGVVLKPCITDGYEFVNTYREQQMERSAVHILVALAFIGERPSGSVIRHLDGVKLHNSPNNLRYGSPQENSNDSVIHGTLSHSEAHPKAKLTRRDVAEIRAARGRVRQVDLAEQFGIAQSGVSAIQLKRIWRHV